jgi:hypothetical protein
MSKSNQFVLWFTGAIIFFGCSSAHNVPASPKVMAVTGVLRVDTAFDKSSLNSDIVILQSSVSGDTLWLDVEYSGGCAAHSFELVSKGLWMKSLPPKLSVYLIHNNHGDACREVIREKLSFLLHAAQYPGQRRVRLSVNEINQNPIEYNY